MRYWLIRRELASVIWGVGLSFGLVWFLILFLVLIVRMYSCTGIGYCKEMLDKKRRVFI